MSSTKSPFDTDAKKKEIQEHYHKFNKFNKEGKWKDALIELQKTLECISELMNHSANTLNNAKRQFDYLSPEQKVKLQQILQSYFAKNFPDKNIIFNASKTYH